MVTLLILFTSISTQLSLPPGLLSAVCYVETHHKIQAMNYNDGGSASTGVCQIKLATARLMGFKGTEKELTRPSVNVYYAGMYLMFQIKRYNGDLRKAVAAYNAGKHKENLRGLTMNRKYVSAVFKAWSENR